MKCQIPQISWHSRDPVLSVDFQPGKRNIQRIASGGTDSHVLIWYVTYQDENKSIKVECASDLYRHNKSVNVVRFSPSGELLASGDDEGAMFLWQLKEREVTEAPKDEDNVNQEDWFPVKLLRGHLEDIYDLSWSSDGNFLVSASMDNTAIVWDIQKFQKLHIFSEHKGYVQGVAWDPLNSFIASVGSDRTLRLFNVNTKKTVFRLQRAPWSVTTEKGSIRARLFYDDTLKSYFRRLSFTPDGELLIVPSGILERDEDKFQNTTYIFSRHAPSKPAVSLPTGDKYTVAVRCNPLLYKLRSNKADVDKENEQPKPKTIIDLPYRMVFAVAAADSILLYDTEQQMPFAYISNIHYTHLTDMSWSPDGRILVASSTDGYSSFLIFGEDELGEVYIPPPPLLEEVKEDEKSVQITTESTIDKGKISVFDAFETDEALLTKTVSSVALEGNKRNIKSPTNDNNFKKIVTSPTSADTVTETPKSTKKPKLFTIKNFFTSPKTQTEENAKPILGKVDIDKGQALSAKNPEAIPKKTTDKNTKPFIQTETMDLSDESIEIVFEGNDEVPGNKPKCKAQLNFEKGNKTLSIINDSNNCTPDVMDTDAVLSFDDQKFENSEIKVDESDWKLELSQDEEPMIVDTVSETRTETKTTDPETPKPKRRVQLITLSKSTSGTPPK